MSIKRNQRIDELLTEYIDVEDASFIMQKLQHKQSDLPANISWADWARFKAYSKQYVHYLANYRRHGSIAFLRNSPIL